MDDVHDGSDVRLIALRRRGGPGVDWSPRPGDELYPSDGLVILATRAGLSRVLARSQPAQIARITGNWVSLKHPVRSYAQDRSSIWFC